jgi:hypothetical protein
MSQNSLEGFGAYRLAMEFFDLVLRADQPAKRAAAIFA